jgi:hypothetical protein
MSILCPKRHQTKSVKGKPVKFEYRLDDSENITGVYRFLVRRCKTCDEQYYLRQCKRIGQTEWGYTREVGKTLYDRASYNLGADRVGSTASEYTKKISRGASLGAF